MSQTVSEKDKNVLGAPLEEVEDASPFLASKAMLHTSVHACQDVARALTP